MAGKRGRPKKVNLSNEGPLIKAVSGEPVMPPVLGQGVGSLTPLSGSGTTDFVRPGGTTDFVQPVDWNWANPAYTPDPAEEARLELLHLAKRILIEMIAKYSGKVFEDMAVQAVNMARLLIKLSKEEGSEQG